MKCLAKLLERNTLLHKSHWRCFSLVAIVVIGMLMIPLSNAETSNDHPIHVSIAVPPTGHYGDGYHIPSNNTTDASNSSARTIRLINSYSHFHVILTNVSTKPVRIWDERCSWGYGALRFEMSDGSGKKRIVRKKPIDWEVNYPRWILLNPGEVAVLNVWLDRNDWEGFQLPNPGSSATIAMRAIYEIQPDKWTSKLGVWTGQVASRKTSVMMINRRNKMK